MALKLNIKIDYTSLQRKIQQVIDEGRQALLDKIRGEETQKQAEDKRNSQAPFGGPSPAPSTPPGFPSPGGGPSTGGIGGYNPYAPNGGFPGQDKNNPSKQDTENRKKSKKEEEKYRASKPGGFTDEGGIRVGHCWLFRNNTDAPLASAFINNQLIIFMGYGEGWGSLDSPSTTIVSGDGLVSLEVGDWSKGSTAISAPNFSQGDAAITYWYCSLDPPHVPICPQVRVVTGFANVGGNNVWDEYVRHMALPCGGDNFILIYVRKYFYRAIRKTVQAYYGESEFSFNINPYGDCPGLGLGPCFEGYDEVANEGCPIDYLYMLYGQSVRDLSCEGSAPWSWGPAAATGGVQSYNVTDGAERIVKAYVCNNKAVREIAVPEKIMQYVDLTCPEVEKTQLQITPSHISGITRIYANTYTSLGNNTFGSGYIPPANGNPGYNYDLGTGLWNDNYTSNYTPAVFWMLQQRIQFTTKQVLIAPSVNFKVIANPTNSGWNLYRNYDLGFGGIDYYPYPSEMYNDSVQLKYSTISSTETPSWLMFSIGWMGQKPKDQQNATLRLSPNRTPKNGEQENPENPEKKYFGNTDDLVIVWDWNDPNYCKDMCLELGFSISDLKPETAVSPMPPSP